MIKSINQYDIQTTPFVATKPCKLSGAQNEDLLMIEPFSASVPVPSIPIASEFVDYSDGIANPVLNDNCNIALEQQTLAAVIYEQGISGSGLFYPEQEAKNLNGSYKRLVWSQIKQAFYNNYRDPTQLFGMEHIDIGLSGTRRYFAEAIRVFSVPSSVFGEKILEGSVEFVDNALDDTCTITDDGKGNLITEENLFSKFQVVGPVSNWFITGSTTLYCPTASSS